LNDGCPGYHCFCDLCSPFLVASSVASSEHKVSFFQLYLLIFVIFSQANKKPEEANDNAAATKSKSIVFAIK
jgi:hypothetical protein